MQFNWILIGLLLNVLIFFLLVSKKSSQCSFSSLDYEKNVFTWAW